MDNKIPFGEAFHALTGNGPFPWQESLYERFLGGNIPNACCLPTGLGKTAVIPIWLIALANNPRQLPRRLVYVVNRRTVVDQSTREAEKIRDRLTTGKSEVLKKLARALTKIAASKDTLPFAISTLRGQFADNGDWRDDPARAAVIVGTVDMIGSRLLFSGYGIGFKSRPLHAGFLGHDALLVHDEAHLEPAFQCLAEAIRDEQKTEAANTGFGRQLQVMALTATPRGDVEPFELTKAERSPPAELPKKLSRPVHYVWQRLKAKKKLKLHAVEGAKGKVAARIVELAKKYAGNKSDEAILVFVNSLDDHASVRKALAGCQVQVLTGTQRGLERDRMVDPRREDACPIFARFLKAPDDKAPDSELWKVTPATGTVFLICTSAGEVGIDLSADHLICDLVSFERMSQRFGRVNRYGTGDARIDVVHEAEPDEQEKLPPLDQSRWATLALLRKLRGDASPQSLSELDPQKRNAAFSPPPTILPTTDILFDAWSLTTIRNKLPGRPPVEPYLHGLTDGQPRETHVAWRQEVEILTDDLLARYDPQDLLEDYPIKPHEMLRDQSSRVFKKLANLAQRQGQQPIWLLDDDGTIERTTLGDLAERGAVERIENRAVLLPPAAGGLTAEGQLDGSSNTADDVADDWRDDGGARRRWRLWDEELKPEGMRLVLSIDTAPDAENAYGDDETICARRVWRWYVKSASADDDMSRISRKAILLDVHVGDVVGRADHISEMLGVPCDLREAIRIAARFHDAGKSRSIFQRSLGNTIASAKLLAKSSGKSAHISEFRHEFGSMVEVLADPQFQAMDVRLRNLALHIIASHHGRARPHFPTEEAFDPATSGRDGLAIAEQVPRRFGQLQKLFGRWGLAYLESLLRAADYAASAEPSSVVEDEA